MANPERDPVVVAHNNHFLGLTKAAFFGCVLTLLLAGVLVLGVFLAYEVGQNRQLSLRTAELARRSAQAQIRTAKLARLGAQAQLFDCALKADLAKRITEEQLALGRSQQFLRDHPDGIPGIPAALIKQGIETQARTISGQQATIVVLDRTLSCPPSSG